VFKSGVQNKNSIVVAKPSIPVANALDSIPRLAVTLESTLNDDINQNTSLLALHS
jgi:hypothetical protein